MHSYMGLLRSGTIQLQKPQLAICESHDASQTAPQALVTEAAYAEARAVDRGLGGLAGVTDVNS